MAENAAPAAMPLAAAESEFARLRRDAQPLLHAAADAYGELCPPDYPILEDNGIPGPGGAFGIRFSAWHSFFVALEHRKKPKKAEPKPTGLAGALDIRIKRMPGDPLPPRDPDERFELALLAMRWDQDRGWVEVRRALPARWTVAQVAEQFEAYLVGFNYDIAAGLPTGKA